MHTTQGLLILIQQQQQLQIQAEERIARLLQSLDASDIQITQQQQQLQALANPVVQNVYMSNSIYILHTIVVVLNTAKL